MSVIIPCYNYARFLPAAIESALSQQHALMEVIIVDDASTDDSVAVARSVARHDSRVRVLVHEVNQGPVATFNDGLAVATGDYLIRLDADDLLTPGSVGRSTAVAEAFPNVSMVYGHPVHFSGDQLPAYRGTAVSWTVWGGRSWLEMRCRLGVNCITSPEVLMRATAVREVGGQRELAHTHDMEMWFRLALHGDVGWISGADQAWHREHDDSLSAREVDVLTDMEERARAFEILFSSMSGGATENRQLLVLARNALANEAIARAAQAYSRGRGGTPEVDRYVRYAESLCSVPADLPHSRILAHARKLGPRQAVYSPYLFAQAVVYRGTRELRALRWRATGL
ncbi:glycosyltransferase [Cryobacterium sp. CG_9.6]|uniref:glycosyltransferase family 2 protein n=1 Tax=Cryobacterium sp. CG_9.6 TaxID=2760710 RepID=UPI002476DE27|nr:glycosyltransferase [Cryobacterium sp. CG_9.6]MDH6238277.1 glycosyltransferase involved in cell wall biosynthesis [Cryobacterium sp. CG_9.6]